MAPSTNPFAALDEESQQIKQVSTATHTAIDKSLTAPSSEIRESEANDFEDVTSHKTKKAQKAAVKPTIATTKVPFTHVAADGTTRTSYFEVAVAGTGFNAFSNVRTVEETRSPAPREHTLVLRKKKATRGSGKAKK